MEYAVGTARLQIRIAESRSLKDKRRVIRSLKDRLRKHHNVAVAEVADQSSWQDATIVVVTVSSAAGHVERVIDAVGREAERILGRSLLDIEIDTLPY